MRFKCSECGKIIYGRDEYDAEMKIAKHWDNECFATKGLEKLSLEELKVLIENPKRKGK